MAGFHVSGLLVIFEFVLLIYILIAASAISIIQPIANSQTSTFLTDTKGWQVNNIDGNNVTYGFWGTNNTTLGDYTDISAYNSMWNISKQHGLYATSVDSFLSTTTIVHDKPGADIHFGQMQYNKANDTAYVNLKLANINKGETDILITEDSGLERLSWKTDYYLSFVDGMAYVTSFNTLFVGWQGQKWLLGVTPMPSGIVNIKYEYNYKNQLFTLYVNGAVYKTISLPINPDVRGYALEYHALDITTDNIDVNGNGLNIFDDGLVHPLQGSSYDNQNVNFMGLQIPLHVDSQYTNAVSVFFTVLVWNVQGLPWWFNIIFIKIELIVFLSILAIVAIGILVSWIP